MAIQKQHASQRGAVARPARLALLAAAVLALGGCASQAYDPAVPADEPVRIVRVRSPLDMEASYRRLYTRLDECLRRSGYHVQPRFDREAGHAWIMVVSGLGLNRYSFIGNRFEARFDIRPAPGGALVEVQHTDRGLIPIVDASEGWLTRDSRGCRA
jgi:hypothetical protein